MVRWADALYGGVTIFLYALGWQLLGFLIADATSGGPLHSLLLTPTATGSITTESIRNLVIGLWFGGTVFSVGTYATIVKVSAEISQESSAETHTGSASDSNRGKASDREARLLKKSS